MEDRFVYNYSYVLIEEHLRCAQSNGIFLASRLRQSYDIRLTARVAPALFIRYSYWFICIIHVITAPALYEWCTIDDESCADSYNTHLSTETSVQRCMMQRRQLSCLPHLRQRAREIIHFLLLPTHPLDMH